MTSVYQLRCKTQPITGNILTKQPEFNMNYNGMHDTEIDKK